MAKSGKLIFQTTPEFIKKTIHWLHDALFAEMTYPGGNMAFKVFQIPSCSFRTEPYQGDLQTGLKTGSFNISLICYNVVENPFTIPGTVHKSS